MPLGIVTDIPCEIGMMPTQIDLAELQEPGNGLTMDSSSSRKLDGKSARQVTQFVRKLRGGAQSSLVVASDGAQYAVKFATNPQGENLLFNEALGSELYRILGLSTAEWAPLYVGDELINENQWAWFELESGRRRPLAGVHFGSKVIGTLAYATYEIIPRSWYPRIQNRDQFWGALVVDAWTEHADNRQAIFTANSFDPTLKATFFDHGHMFRGAIGNEPFKFIRPMFLDRDIYDESGAQAVIERWILKIQSLSAKHIEQALSNVPIEWRNESTACVCDRLLERRQEVEAYFFKELERLPKRHVSYTYAARDLRINSAPRQMLALHSV